MGKVQSAVCMICGEEFPINELEPIFVGRTKYRCMKCVDNGRKEANSRTREVFSHGYFKKLREK